MHDQTQQTEYHSAIDEMLNWCITDAQLHGEVYEIQLANHPAALNLWHAICVYDMAAWVNADDHTVQIMLIALLEAVALLNPRVYVHLTTLSKAHQKGKSS